MPRANRYFLPGHIWHITHRCHKKEFLLKFTGDRKSLDSLVVRSKETLRALCSELRRYFQSYPLAGERYGRERYLKEACNSSPVAQLRNIIIKKQRNGAF